MTRCLSYGKLRPKLSRNYTYFNAKEKICSSSNHCFGTVSALSGCFPRPYFVLFLEPMPRAVVLIFRGNSVYEHPDAGLIRTPIDADAVF